jgi:hypothetical protein
VVHDEERAGARGRCQVYMVGDVGVGDVFAEEELLREEVGPAQGGGGGSGGGALAMMSCVCLRWECRVW